MKNLAFYTSLLINILFVLGFLYIVQALGGFAYLKAKMKTKGLAGVYEHRKNLLRNLPMPDSAVVFLGNSLTAHCEWSDLLRDGRVVNRGIAGDMTGGMLLRLDEITKHQPAKIFLLIGINDLSVHSKETILDNYEKIVDNIRTNAPKTKLYIQSLLPVNNEVRSTGKDNQDILFLNDKIKGIASKYNLDYVNLHSLFIDETGKLKSRLTQDGIHLDAEGYQIWKRALIPYL